MFVCMCVCMYVCMSSEWIWNCSKMLANHIKVCAKHVRFIHKCLEHACAWLLCANLHHDRQNHGESQNFTFSASPRSNVHACREVQWKRLSAIKPCRMCSTRCKRSFRAFTLLVTEIFNIFQFLVTRPGAVLVDVGKSSRSLRKASDATNTLKTLFCVQWAIKLMQSTFTDEVRVPQTWVRWGSHKGEQNIQFRLKINQKFSQTQASSVKPCRKRFRMTCECFSIVCVCLLCIIPVQHGWNHENSIFFTF